MKDGGLAERSIFEGYSPLLKQRWQYERLGSTETSGSINSTALSLFLLSFAINDHGVLSLSQLLRGR